MQTSAEVIPLFSSPVYVTVDNTMPNVIEQVEQLDYMEFNRTFNAGKQTYNQNVLNDLPDLKEWLTKHIEEYCFGVMGIDTESHTLEITCSWVNRHDQMDRAHEHVHRNSMFSGIIYLQTEEGCGDLVFLNNAYQMISPRLAHPNVYNAKKWTVSPLDHMVVIFPSDLVHYVSQNNRSRPRYSLAFNIMVKGTFGNPTSFLTL